MKCPPLRVFFSSGEWIFLVATILQLKVAKGDFLKKWAWSTDKWQIFEAFHTCIPPLVTSLLGFHISEFWKRYISLLDRASLQLYVRIPLSPGPWAKLCGCSHCRVFSAPWNVEPAYNPESPAEQWCIQPHKSQIHGSSDSAVICEIFTTVYLVHSLIKIS